MTMPEFLQHMLAAAVPTIGAVWYLGSKFGAFHEKVREHDRRIIKLEELPERVARLEPTRISK